MHIFKYELSITRLNYGLGIVPTISAMSPNPVRYDRNATVTIQYFISTKFYCNNDKKILNWDPSIRFFYDLGNIIPSQSIDEIIGLIHFHKWNIGIVMWKNHDDPIHGFTSIKLGRYTPVRILMSYMTWTNIKRSSLTAWFTSNREIMV